ncbi:MAG: RNA 2',3'-cyclic phosphodiesterase [Candidatus Omnitrophica bacterium]|nr:RNA 2',3'-cyclic phosphodiesterase [Candidatus Omnitrophota bacterium]
MSSIRAFIAVEIDHQTKQKISELISNLKKSDADAKWITEGQIHLTLKFLGNIDEGSVHKISDALSGVSNNFNSFTINFSEIGAFPNLNHPAVIWLGVNKGAEFLKTLNEKIETALEKLRLKQENREFKPHLTLARIRSPNNIQNLVKLIEETDFNSWDDLRISKLTLFQSTLNPKGAAYTIIIEKYLQNI